VRTAVSFWVTATRLAAVVNAKEVRGHVLMGRTLTEGRVEKTIEGTSTAGFRAYQSGHGCAGTRAMQPPNSLALYEERLASLWERSVAMLGIHTVRVLLRRAIWQTAQHHPDLALIHHDDAGLSFDALEQSYATRPPEQIEAAFTDLSTEMLLILARLLGLEKAERTGADRANPRQAGAGQT
jgi:hypothetical protein